MVVFVMGVPELRGIVITREFSEPFKPRQSADKMSDGEIAYYLANNPIPTAISPECGPRKEYIRRGVRQERRDFLDFDRVVLEGEPSYDVDDFYNTVLGEAIRREIIPKSDLHTSQGYDDLRHSLFRFKMDHSRESNEISRLVHSLREERDYSHVLVD